MSSPSSRRKRLTGEGQDKSTKNMYWRNKSWDFFENKGYYYWLAYRSYSLMQAKS